MAEPTKFPKLFEPGFIGEMRARNRLVMSPMATNFAAEDGQVTDLLIDHYEQRAKGGVGLVIVEGICVDYPRGKGWSNEASIGDDRYIPGLRKLADAVHRHGAKVALQLHHAGREARQSFTGLQPVGPSPLPSPGHEEPKELATAEIEEIVSYFAQAAVRAKKSGFDGVEIHAAHGYLLGQFISGVSNKRQDEYGGELTNRARFLCEVIKGIRDAVGKGYPVWCRLNGEESGVEGGITCEESRKVAKMAQEAGCDALHISTYGYGAEAINTLPEMTGRLVPLAEGVKKVVSIPVIAVGAMSPQLGEEVLEKGKADFVAMGRELLCDPELPNEVIQGRLEDIAPCIHCLSCFDRLLVKNGKVACSVNATLGTEPSLRISPAARSKRVLVVGGGPAGLEAARVAALRGHKVTLYDTETELGGQMLLASVPPHKERIRDYIDYITAQIYKLNVEVEMGKQVTPELVQQMKPDVVIVATGVIPILPAIPGLDKVKTVFAQEVLRGNVEVGGSVAIIGGGMVGCETAELLTDRGKKVTIVEVLPRLATDMTPMLRAPLLSRLRAKGVTMLTGVSCEAVSEAGVVVVTKQGQRQTISADTLVIAAGSSPSKDLYQALEGKVSQIHLIGDAVQPRTILEAVSEGFHTGIAL